MSTPPPTPPPRTKRKKPIQPPSIPVEVNNGGESSDTVYQNAAAVTGTPPKRNLDGTVRYENVSPLSISSGPSDVEDTQEIKKKPVARMRNSIRNRGSSPADSAAVPPALGLLDEGGRGESISPDLRNNAPSPKPRPRGKRNLPESRSFDGNDNTAESRTPPPLPPAKPYSGPGSSASGQRGGPPEPPPKVPKTVVTDVTSSSSSSLSTVGKKKPIPPPPRKESTPERHSGGAFLPNKKSPTGSQDRSEVQASDLVTDEDPYSSVDTTQFTDTGPSIQVLDERSGKTLPLDFVEKELETVGEADTSKSSSILDAIMSLVGDDVLADVEKDDDEPDIAELTTVHRDFSFSDEAPPIPAHTLASMELVEPVVPTPRDGGGGGGGGAVGGSGGAVGGGRGNEDLLSSTYDVVVATTDSVYEQPAEPPRLVLPISGQKSSSYHGPHIGRGVPPPLPSPNRPTESSSTAVAISTMARSTNDTAPNNTGGHTKQKKGLFSAFKKDKKKDKDKAATEEVSSSATFGTGIVKSPSINTMSSSTSSSHSPMHDRANNKYSFPGDLGYGVRIKKPVGPRREPPHWANSLLPPIANKA